MLVKMLGEEEDDYGDAALQNTFRGHQGCFAVSSSGHGCPFQPKPNPCMSRAHEFQIKGMLGLGESSEKVRPLTGKQWLCSKGLHWLAHLENAPILPGRWPDRSKTLASAHPFSACFRHQAGMCTTIQTRRCTGSLPLGFESSLILFTQHCPTVFISAGICGNETLISRQSDLALTIQNTSGKPSATQHRQE